MMYNNKEGVFFSVKRRAAFMNTVPVKRYKRPGKAHARPDTTMEMGGEPYVSNLSISNR